jgi:heme A synthase
MRQFLSIAIPILTPMALYMAWISAAQWRARTRGLPEMPQYGDAPWTMLAAAGIALLAITLGATALLSGDDPRTAYQPPRIIDGKIIPGTAVRP